jgi:predicted PurR-regulated permease PerM
MTASKQTKDDRDFDKRVMQAAVRLSLLALLVFWCLRILGPFINPILGGVVIAIAVQTPYAKLTRALGGRPKLAAALLVVIALLVLITPTIALGGSLVDSTADVSSDLIHDEIRVPPPPEAVAEWPLIGERLHALWLGASQNLESVLVKLAPYFKDVGVWLVSTVGDLGLGLLMFVVAIFIAGVLLPHGERAARLARNVAFMIAGERGPQMAELAA